MTIYTSCTFETATTAMNAVEDLVRAGFYLCEIDLIMSRETQRRLTPSARNPVSHHTGTSLAGIAVAERLRERFLNASGRETEATRRSGVRIVDDWALSGPLAEALARRGRNDSVEARRLYLACLLGMSYGDVERVSRDVRCGRVVVGMETLEHERLRVSRILRARAREGNEGRRESSATP